jgi:hypothetical protein
MSLKITTINHLKTLSFHIVGSIIMLVFLCITKFDHNFVFAAGIVWIIFTLPVAWLHIEYSLINSNEEFEINEHYIILRKSGKEFKFDKEQIESIILYLTPGAYKHSDMKFVAIESYYFARVKMKSGEVLTLTCLLTNNLESELKHLSGVLFKRTKRIFCTTLY